MTKAEFVEYNANAEPVYKPVGLVTRYEGATGFHKYSLGGQTPEDTYLDPNVNWMLGHDFKGADLIKVRMQTDSDSGVLRINTQHDGGDNGVVQLLADSDKLQTKSERTFSFFIDNLSGIYSLTIFTGRDNQDTNVQWVEISQGETLSLKSRKWMTMPMR